MNKKTKKKIAVKENLDKIEQVQEEKHVEEEQNQEKPIENGNGITIVLS